MTSCDCIPTHYNGMSSPVLAVNGSAAKLFSRLIMDDTGYDVCLQYGNATTRYAWTPIYDRYWSRWRLVEQANGFWAFNYISIYDAIKAWNDNDVTVTYNGAWAAGAAAAALGISYQRSETINHYAQFDVTPGAGGKIYIVLSYLSNGGYGAVTIDGGTALVNELPLVDGYKQVSCYAAASAYNNRILIASGLDAATAYTVRLTVVDDRPAGSSGDRVYFEGYGIFTETIDDPQIGTVTYDVKSLLIAGEGSSANEYAYHYKPPAPAGNYEWTGSAHGNENIASVTWTDQAGNAVTVDAVDTKASAERIVVTHRGTSRHTETGATDHANFVCIQNFNSLGLDVTHTHWWLTACDFDLSYPAMFSMLNAIDLGHVAGDEDEIYDLTGDDDADYGETIQRLSAFISDDWVLWMFMPNLTGVDGWVSSELFHFIQDRIDTINKAYAQRTGGANGVANETAAVGDVWQSWAQYRVSYIPDAETEVKWW